MGLLTDLDAGKTKQPFQTYIIEHGIERLNVKVPQANARRFEIAVDEAVAGGLTSKQHLIAVVSAHGGSEMRG